MNSGTPPLQMRGHKANVKFATFSPDGKRVITTSRDATARIWDAETGEEVFTLEMHAGPLTSGAFSPDSQRVVTTADKTARIWDVRTGQELMTLRGHDALVRFATFSHDGKHVVTASVDRTARVWQIE